MTLPKPIRTSPQERAFISRKLLMKSINETIENAREQRARSRSIIERSNEIVARIRRSMARSQQMQEQLGGGRINRQ